MDFHSINFDDSFPFIKFEDALHLSGYKQAAHCCIYSLNSYPLFKDYKSAALVAMQMRFDGHLGFAGGLIDQDGDSDIVTGLNRELVEEINLNEQYFTTQKDYCSTHIDKEKKRCLHFYAKEVSVQDFKEIEKQALDAADYGKEVMGVIRVPLFTMRDGIRGFPAFLSNSFVGNAKAQLLHFLCVNKIMSLDEIQEALKKSKL